MPSFLLVNNITSNSGFIQTRLYSNARSFFGLSELSSSADILKMKLYDEQDGDLNIWILILSSTCETTLEFRVDATRSLQLGKAHNLIPIIQPNKLIIFHKTFHLFFAFKHRITWKNRNYLLVNYAHFL